MSQKNDTPEISDNTPSPTPEYAPKGSAKAKLNTFAAVAHTLPFFLWVGVMALADMMHLLPSSGSEDIETMNLVSDAWMYSIRTVICVVALCLLRPWRWYPALQMKNLMPAIGIGLLVFVLWIGLETQFIRNLAPGFAELYEKYCVKPLGEIDGKRVASYYLENPSPYMPAVCGWTLTIMRLLGSAFVIAIIEEFFWRGYLLRTVRTPDFLDLEVGYYHPKSFFIIAVVFAFMHHEVAAAFLTALIYGYFYLFTRDIWAVVIAHVTTNLVLGLYAMWTGYWWFWV